MAVSPCSGHRQIGVRVVWHDMRDWVTAQLALCETEIVNIPQVCLPFAMDAKGQTLYEKMVEGKFFFGDGQSEPCILMQAAIMCEIVHTHLLRAHAYTSKEALIKRRMNYGLASSDYQAP